MVGKYTEEFDLFYYAVCFDRGGRENNCTLFGWIAKRDKWCDSATLLPLSSCLQTWCRRQQVTKKNVFGII